MEMFVVDEAGLLLDTFEDADLLAARPAGGIGSEFFYWDTETSIVRSDLERGTWARVYDAGVPIIDLAVQQVPEPGSLWRYAAALASTLAARRRRPADENERPLLLAPGRVKPRSIRAALGTALLLLAPTLAHAAPIAFGDLVVLTANSVVRLERAAGYAPSAPQPITADNPRAVDAAPNGSVYVLDEVGGPSGPSDPDRIVELSPDGSERVFTPVGSRPWGPSGEAIDVFLLESRDMSLGRDGRLWIADQNFRAQDPALGFDGSVERVDPTTGAIEDGPGQALGTEPRFIDLGAYAGGAIKPDLSEGTRAIAADGQSTIRLTECDLLGCSRLDLTLSGDVAVLRDGRIVTFGHRDGLVDAISNLFLLDTEGRLLEEFVDAGVGGRFAGGIGNEFFFMDSPTSIARFDLETGTRRSIYDAGLPIIDLAVQQIPEPEALWLLAAALASIVATRRWRASDVNVRPLLLAPGRVKPRSIRAALGTALLLLAPTLAHAGPIALGDIVVLTGTGVVRLDAANAYAPDPVVPVPMNDPQAIDVAKDGTVFVLDQGIVNCCQRQVGDERLWPFVPVEIIPNRIVELAPDGTLRAFSPRGERRTSIDGEEFDSLLIGPRDMALGRDGLLWIADQDYNSQTDLGFDGDLVAVDPATERIGSVPDSFRGTSPRSIDIGPYAGEIWHPDGSGAPRFSTEGAGLRICNEEGCDGFYFQGGGVILRDGRYLALVANAIDFDREGEVFGEPDPSGLLSDLIVFDGTGLVLEIFKDTLLYAPEGFRSRWAGGIGDEFFFMDTPTSIARFDLDTGEWARIYDAGETIYDLSVQQTPEPGSLILLASALASIAAVRRRRSR